METKFKDMCNGVIYGVLSKENPSEYPVGNPNAPAMFTGDVTLSSSGGSCTVKEEFGEMTIPNCDCSDPKKYDFYDKGRF